MQPLVLMLVLLASASTHAQEWSFGPKVYLGTGSNRTLGDQVRIGSATVTTADYGDAVGRAFGAFARYDRPRWYAQAELVRGRYSLANADISGPGGSETVYPYARRTDARLLAGLKPLPWLRLSAGVIGVRNNWEIRDLGWYIRYNQDYIKRYPAEREQYLRQIERYEVTDAVQRSFSRTNVESQVGLGADIGGLTLDLTYNYGLNPVLREIRFQNQTYALRQRYTYWSLNVGYRILPLKSHLLAPRKNRAYQRLQRDIPFYRNEFHVGLGLLGEDIGSQVIYENRYTRYFRRRLGLTAGLTYQRGLEGFNPQPVDPSRGYYSGGRVAIDNTVTLLAGIRFLPLYTRWHRVGLVTGPQLTYSDQTGFGGGSRTVQIPGQAKPIYFSPTNLRDDSRRSGFQTGWHSSLDYQFSATDRLVVGPWLRVFGQSFIIPDYASAGFQAGYRF